MSNERYAEVIRGVDFIWNNKFDEAENLFEAKKDNDPRYALHFAEAVFLRSFITADAGDTHLAMTRLKSAKNLAEEHLKVYEKGQTPSGQVPAGTDPSALKNALIDTRIVVGDSLYMIAILQMTRDAKIKGAFNLRKSWKVFEKALKESKGDSKVDVEITRSLEFGAGFFLFAMSIIPQKFLKLIELAGFKADREGGLHYIKACHKNGGIRGPYSTMVLLFNNLLLPRGLSNAQQYLIEAEELIAESLAKYPQGSLFHVMGSHCARKQMDVEKGIKLMETALDNSKHLKQPPHIYRYELANCYCMKMEWKKAVELYEPLLELPKFQVRALCALQLAACYIMLGEKDKAKELMIKLQSFAGSKSHFDPIVVRQAKRYVANGGNFAAFELLYLRRDLAKMNPIMKQVLESLDKMASQTKALDKTASPGQPQKAAKFGLGKLNLGKMSPFKNAVPTDTAADDRAAYLLLRGSMLKALDRNDEAIVCYREVVDGLADLVTEKLYIPYCLYELGESYYMNNNVKEAEEMMKRCSKYSGYDWEDPLKIRLRVTMEQLKKGTLPPNEPVKPPSLDALADAQLNSSDDKDLEDEDDDKLEEEEEDADE